MLDSNQKLYMHIIDAVKELNIPQLPSGSCKTFYNAYKNSAVIFITSSKGELTDIKSMGGNDKRLLDVDKYCFSFESTKSFFERTLANKFLK